MGFQGLNILIAGVGGQGNILASHVIGEAALLARKNAIVGEVFGVSVRGGSVVSHVRVGDDVLSPLSPAHGAHVICGLEPMESLRVAYKYIRSDGIVITNTRPVHPISVNRGAEKHPEYDKIVKVLNELCWHVFAFDATKVAEDVGDVVTTNMVLVGAFSNIASIGLSVKNYEDAIRRVLGKVADVNITAFRLGRKAGYKISKDI